MLLRRITKHVTDQNWFAVFIDFLIVVVGVFIGIQVANWNERQAEHELAKRYVAQLKGDIRADMVDIDTSFTTSEWRLAALTVLLEKAGIPTVDKYNVPERELIIARVPIADDTITYLMNAAAFTRFLDDDQPAYHSLVNAGNARLIGQLKPWPCIQSYYAQYKEVRLFEERLLLFRTEMVRTLHDAGLSIAGNVAEKETLERIHNQPALSASMSSYRLFTYYYMSVLDELRQGAKLLLTALETDNAECDFDKGTL